MSATQTSFLTALLEPPATLPPAPVEPEDWRPIEDYIRYEVSSLGRFRNKATGKIVLPYKGDCGYGKINLTKDGKARIFLAHRVIAAAFHSQASPDRRYVNHINHDRMDNRACNLEWTTHSENMQRTKKAKMPPIKAFTAFPRSGVNEPALAVR